MESSQPFSLTDTPHKSAPTVSLTRTKMRVQDVEDAVERDIKNLLYTVDTEAFIEKMIPKNSTTVQSLKKLKDHNHYKDCRWANFPQTPPSGKEKSLYKPFARASNAIVRTIPHKVPTKIVYLDRHSTTPKSLEADMASGRPDGVGAASDLVMEELEAKIRKLEEEIAANPHKADEKQGALSEQRRKQEDLFLSYKLWWMRIHLPYEIKPTRPGWYETVKQLLTYMRQMLIEQLDRRFVLGFILCFDELRLVLLDRSGVTVTKTPINIHDEAEKFIRIITGFSSMKPEDLGWDTSMEIYRPLSNDTRPSYEVGPEFQGVFGTGRYHIHWVIDVVENGQVVKYVTVSIISALRSAEICGRATVVYEVISFENRHKPTETRALKRYWRPIVTDNIEDYPSEGEIYELLDKDKPYEAKHMYAFHDVEVNGRIDSTLKFIRHGLEAKPFKRPIKSLPIRHETHADAEPRLMKRDVPENSPLPFFEPSTFALVDRHHTNILMPMGEVITMDSSLWEFLICFRGSIEEHDDAHDQGILHRDISAGNILIFENSNGQSFGRLMDYDHAKKTKSFSPLTSKTKGLSDAELEDTQRGVQSIIKLDDRSMVVEDDVVREALRWVKVPSIAAHYVMSSAKIIQPASGSRKSPITMSDLRWDNEPTKQWPNFLERTHREGERAGTLSYMSGEVIARMSLVTLPGVDEPPPFVHEATHDLESFLWVLVRICMSRKGPGIGMRRKEELDPTKQSFDADLSAALVRYFEGTEDVLEKSKTHLLQFPRLFENEIVKYFHSYFEPLKPLVRKWWNIIILGYRYRGNEFYNIHKHIIRILDDTLATLPDQTGDEATQKELARRKQRREHLLGIFKNTAPLAGNNALITTPPGSPPTSLIATPPHYEPLTHQIPHSEQDSPSAASTRKEPPSKKKK